MLCGTTNAQGSSSIILFSPRYALDRKHSFGFASKSPCRIIITSLQVSVYATKTYTAIDFADFTVKDMWTNATNVMSLAMLQIGWTSTLTQM